MIIWLLVRVYRQVERVMYTTLSTLLCFCCAISVAHYCGWIERFIWWSLEREATKLLNKTPVTVGSFRIDWSQILQGGRITLHASNVILHTPQREVWGWESPLLARIGHATVEVNAPITIFHELILRQKLPIEVFSVVICDVQVFVERHDEIFNVYLCDPAAVLPTPPYWHVTPPSAAETKVEGDGNDGAARPRSTSEPCMGNTNTNTDDMIVGDAHDDKNPSKQQHKQQAEKLVQDMLQAVQNLGRAAQRGSLQSAVKQQGLEMAEILRDGWSARDGSNLQEGVAVMKQVGKVAAKSLQAPKRILPTRKVNDDGPKPPLVRVGRIVLRDVRIFTKDSWIQLSNHINGDKDIGTIATATATAPPPTDGKESWNTPIFIETLIVRAAELCPPLSAKEEGNPDLPAVYQPVDKVIVIVWRRLLAEIAKSNSGRLFSTAVGEVLSLIQTTNHQSNTSLNGMSGGGSGRTTPTSPATTTTATTATTTQTTTMLRSKSPSSPSPKLPRSTSASSLKNPSVRSKITTPPPGHRRSPGVVTTETVPEIRV